MHKQKKMLIILSAFLAVLLVAWGLATWLPPRLQSEETTSATQLSVDPVVTFNAQEITEIRITNSKGTLMLVSSTITKDDKETLVWIPKDQDEMAYDEQGLTSMVNNLVKMLAVREIETGATDLARYGLDTQAVRIVYVTNDGRETAVLIGDTLSSGSSSYVTLEGSGRVCAVPNSTTDPLHQGPLDWLDKTAAISLSYNDLVHFRMTRVRDGLELEVECERNGDTENQEEPALAFQIISPLNKEGASSRLRPLISQITDLVVKEYVELSPVDLAKYGLDQPTYVFELRTNQDSVTVSLGKAAESGSLYMMTDKLDAVMTVETANLDRIDAPLLELVDSFVSLYSIGKVERIDADVHGTSFSVEIDMEEGMTASDEAAAFRLNGNDAKIFTESRRNLFAAFYQRLISITIAGLDLDANPVNTTDASLVFSLRADPNTGEATRVVLVEFARRDDYTDYVFIDGQYAGYYINREAAFTSDRDNFEGILPAYQRMLDAIDQAVDGVFDTEEGRQQNGS